MAHVGAQILRHLPGQDLEVDCFYAALPDSAAPEFIGNAEIRAFTRSLEWAPDRWYSRSPLARFLTAQVARTRTQRALMSALEGEHAKRPYDVLYQFSQIELFGLRRWVGRVPVVLHPEVHAAGELRWHRRERALARVGESIIHHAIVRGMLTARATLQRRDIRLAAGVIAPSDSFAAELHADYGVPPESIQTIPNPIDLERFRVGKRAAVERNGQLTVLFISRIAVRKGVEMVVELSHRLADLRGRVRLIIAGGQGSWSDYRPLLRQLNPSVGEYIGRVPPDQLPDLLARADLLIQPSHYEPFALTVGEALASGCPVVVSDKVGAGEGLDPRCAVRFRDGDADALEAAVREMSRRLREDGTTNVLEVAQAEARRRFEPSAVASEVASFLRKCALK